MKLRANLFAYAQSEDSNESEDNESEDYKIEDYESEDGDEDEQECEECTDEPSPWMLRNGIECDDAGDRLLNSKCGNNERWISEEYCMWTCFERGSGYANIMCCKDKQVDLYYTMFGILYNETIVSG